MNTKEILLFLNPYKEVSGDEVTLNSLTKIADNKCNQDGMIINFKHSSEDFSRTLSLYPDVDVDENGLLLGKFNGFIKKEEPEEEEETTPSHIEGLRTTLAKEIKIEFKNEKKIRAYEKMPIVILNIEKKYEDLYSSYSTEYIRDKQMKYIGVKITFNELKVKSQYPPVNIIIIGDESGNPLLDTVEELIDNYGEDATLIEIYNDLKED